MVFLDFRKAFDSVPHTKLINKLVSLNFPKAITSWVHSYLYGRRQRVCVRDNASDWSPVTSGVPQGSVLGPLLFNIYISDLPNVIFSENCSYADDLKIYAPSFLFATLQFDLDRVVEWSHANGLDLNPDKCFAMHFGHNNPRYSYTIKSKTVATKNEHQDLGILVDSSLKFYRHADHVISKTMRKAHFIFKSFCNLTPVLFKILYTTFLRPVLEYCVQISRPCSMSSLSRLESCQRRLTKWCKPLKHLSYEERLQCLKLPTLEKRFKRGDMILVFQILNRHIDINPSNFFCYAPRTTRGHNFRLIGSKSNHNFRQKFFTERCVSLWNSLPIPVVNATSVNSFKARLDEYL